MVSSTSKLPSRAGVGLGNAPAPTKCSSTPRGRSLRVERVVTDVRGAEEALLKHGLDRDDKRIQEDMIDMLTKKIAKYVKENELLRRNQETFDTEKAMLETQLNQVKVELTTFKTQSVEENKQLAQELQVLRVQSEQNQVDLQSERVLLQEMRRQRERDLQNTRQFERNKVETIEKLQQELSKATNEKKTLQQTIEHLLTQSQEKQTIIASLQEEKAKLQEQLTLAKECNLRIQSDVVQDQKDRSSEMESIKGLEQEKMALEEKNKAILKSLKEAEQKAIEWEKKCMTANKNVDGNLTELAGLKKENNDLKTKKSQLNSQNKLLQGKLNALEVSEANLKQQIAEKKEETERMKKTCREFQFRIKQLQEQCTYLEKKKTKEIQIPLQTPATLDDNNNVQDTANSQIVKADTSALSPNSSASSIHIPDAALHPESDAPSWMRD